MAIAASSQNQKRKPTLRKLAFGYSTQCNLRCGHCIAAGEEHSSKTMDFDRACEIIGELAKAGVGGISFTAGEPFLFFEDILQLVKLCSEHNIYSRIVTNGYWATSPLHIQQKIDQLLNNGLCQLRISSSRWHQQQVKLSNIINAAGYCRAVGLDCFISFVTDFSDNDVQLEKGLKESGIKFFIEPMIYAGRAQHLSPPPVLTDFQANCCAMNPYLTPSYDFYGCCDVGCAFTETDFFHLGNLATSSCDELLTRFEQNHLYNLIREQGLSQMAVLAGYLSKDVRHYRKCELCLKLFNNQEKLLALSQSVKDLQSWKR